jgi:hypothetical protein
MGRETAPMDAERQLKAWKRGSKDYQEPEELKNGSILVKARSEASSPEAPRLPEATEEELKTEEGDERDDDLTSEREEYSALIISDRCEVITGKERFTIPDDETHVFHLIAERVWQKEGYLRSRYFKEREPTEILMESPFKEKGICTCVDLTGWVEQPVLTRGKANDLGRYEIGYKWWEWSKRVPKERAQVKKVLLSVFNLDEDNWDLKWGNNQSGDGRRKNPSLKRKFDRRGRAPAKNWELGDEIKNFHWTSRPRQLRGTR